MIKRYLYWRRYKNLFKAFLLDHFHHFVYHLELRGKVWSGKIITQRNPVWRAEFNLKEKTLTISHVDGDGCSSMALDQTFKLDMIIDRFKPKHQVYTHVSNHIVGIGERSITFKIKA